MNVADYFNKAFFNQEWDEVIRLKDELQTLLEAVNDKNAKAVFFINLGIAYRHVGDINKAIQYQKSAYTIYKKLNNENGIGYCYCNLGNAYLDLGLFNEALEFYEKATEKAKKTGDSSLGTAILSSKLACENEIKKRTTVITHEQGKEVRFRDSQIVRPTNKSDSYSEEKYKMLDLSEREKIFVSYSRKDSSAVKSFVHDLISREFSLYFDLNDNPIDDPHSLEVGLSDGLTQCYAMIVCLSKNYVDSKWCRSEINNFLFQSILEGRINDLPILFLDLDGKTNRGEVLLMCFGKLAINKRTLSLQSKFLDARIGFVNKLEWNIERILAENETTPNLVLESIPKISFDNNNTINIVEQITKKLIEIRQKWLDVDSNLNPTFSDIKDFYRILDDSLDREMQNWNMQEKERILDVLVSRFPKNEILPTLTEADAVWKYMFKHFKGKTVAQEINIKEVLNELIPFTNYDEATKSKIERLSEPALLRIFIAITQKEQRICLFDRPFTESSQYYRNLEKDFDTDRKRLEPRILRGHPLQLIFGEAQRRNFIAPLQYTYYKYMMQNPRNELIDAVVIAGLLITIEMWEERMNEKVQFNELIIEPLSTGSDIWSLFHSIENLANENNQGKKKTQIIIKDWLGSGSKVIKPEDG